MRFSHTYLTLDAAAAGQGVAVASDVLAGDAVRQGQLAWGRASRCKAPTRTA
jgi:LysR family transcriptional regulator, glycine cleavage system transcriptional activator